MEVQLLKTKRTDKNRDWGPFALLLIDVQTDFWDEVGTYFPDFPDNVRRLLDFCRAEGVEVIHLRAMFKPDLSDAMPYYRLKRRELPCIEGTGGVQPESFALELGGEKVFHKQVFDGFLNPELDAYLRERGKKFLITAGLVTSICVFLTTASAYQRGYLTALVTDCCADTPKNHQSIITQYDGMCFDTATLRSLPEQYQVWRKEMDLLNTQGESM